MQAVSGTPKMMGISVKNTLSLIIMLLLAITKENAKQMKFSMSEKGTSKSHGRNLIAYIIFKARAG